MIMGVARAWAASVKNRVGGEEPWPALVVLVALVPLVRFTAESLEGLDYLLFHYLSDDAFYYYEISRHIPEFNRGIPTSGFHPLLAFLVAPLHRLLEPGPAIIASLGILAAAQGLGAVFLYRMLARMWCPAVAFAGAAAWACSGKLFAIAMTGMETVLAAALVALFYARFLTLEQNQDQEEVPVAACAVLGLTAGVAFLARMDSPIILAPAVAWMCVKSALAGRRRQCVALILGCVVLPLLWIGWIWWQTGSPFPTSGQALRLLSGNEDRGWAVWDAGYERLSKLTNRCYAYLLPDFLRRTSYAGPLAACSGVAGAWLVWTRPWLGNWHAIVRCSFMIALGLLLWAGYYSFYQGVIRSWYAGQLAMLGFGVLLPVIIAPWVGLLRGRLLALIPIIVLTMQSFGSTNLGTGGRQVYDKFHAGLAANRLFPTIAAGKAIGSFNSGAYDYVTDFEVYNLDGVVNPEAVEAIRADALPEYLRSRDITFIIDHDTGANLRLLHRDRRVQLERLVDLREYYQPFGPQPYTTVITWLWRVNTRRAD